MSETIRISELVCAKCGYVSKAGDSVCPNDGTELRPTQQADLSGTILDGKYKIISLLGSGGMGSVYEAKHLMLDSTVAVKVLHMQATPGEAERIRRFNQEGKLISALKHPNIISALDFGVHENQFAYLVMDYAEGKSLHEELRMCKRLAPARAVKIFAQVCDALEYAHSKGIVHRDVKPSNIMLVKAQNGEEQVKLLDFGVAKMMDDASGSHGLTKTGMVFGSPPYMSPEQCLGRPPSPQSDIYSLGCVMYETLTGITPINGENSLQILHNQISGTPLAFKELPLQLTVPPVIESIVLKTLAKNPQDRYQSMAELKQDFVRWQSDKSFRGAAVAKPMPTKMLAGATLLTIALAGAAFMFLHRWPVHNAKSTAISRKPLPGSNTPAPAPAPPTPATASATASGTAPATAPPPAVPSRQEPKLADPLVDQDILDAGLQSDAGHYDKAAAIYKKAAEKVTNSSAPNKTSLLRMLTMLETEAKNEQAESSQSLTKRPRLLQQPAEQTSVKPSKKEPQAATEPSKANSDLRIANVPYQPAKTETQPKLGLVQAIGSQAIFLKATQLERRKQWDEAAQIYSQLSQSDPPNSLFRARDLLALGRVQCKQQESSAGKSNIQDALNIIDSLSGAPEAIRLPLLADCDYFFSQKDWQTAQLLAGTLLHKMQANNETQGAIYCKALFYYGSTGERMKQYGIANDKLNECVRVFRALNPLEQKILSKENRMDLAEDLATCALQLHDFRSAKLALTEVEKMASQFDPNDLRMYRRYYLTAEYAKDTNDSATARTNAQKMLEIAVSRQDDKRIGTAQKFLHDLH